VVAIEGASRTESGDNSSYINWFFKFSGKIRVKNLAYQKKITVLYGTASYTDDWTTVEAVYVKSLDNGYELWSFSTPEIKKAGWKVSQDREFAVKYEVNSSEYWDNNNGKNYKAGAGYNPSNPRIALGDDTRIYAPMGYLNTQTDSKQLNCGIYLRNLAYQKNVFVRYTTDGWKTFIDAPASYQSSIGNNYGTPAELEYWQAAILLPLSTTSVQYAVSYTVNGMTYWDSNFGSNYTIGQ
jgi:hypothetical protein